MWSLGHAESQTAASPPSLCVTHYLLSKFFYLKHTRNSPKSACYAMAVNARCSFLEVSEYIQVCRIMLTMIKKPLMKAFKINKESVSMSSQRPFPCREKGPPHGASGCTPLSVVCFSRSETCHLQFRVQLLGFHIFPREQILPGHELSLQCLLDAPLR